jgi:phosphoserine phosphatase
MVHPEVIKNGGLVVGKASAGGANMATVAVMPKEKVKAIWRKADAVCFDVDSTVCPTEAIDELAAYCGKKEEVERVTREAMGGNMEFREALRRRLNIIRPTRSHIARFLRDQPHRLTPGIKDLVDLLHKRGVDVYLVSGGFRCLIEPVAEDLGIPRENIFANALKFYFNGTYAGFDETEPTSQSGGKALVVKMLKDKFEYKNLVTIGDGATDLETYPPADAFIGFGGIVIREAVRARSGWFVTSFHELVQALNK